MSAGDGPRASSWSPTAICPSPKPGRASSARSVGLSEGGADCILIETMMDLAEAIIAVEAPAKPRSARLLHLSFQENGRTVFG